MMWVTCAGLSQYSWSLNETATDSGSSSADHLAHEQNLMTLKPPMTPRFIPHYDGSLQRSPLLFEENLGNDNCDLR